MTTYPTKLYVVNINNLYLLKKVTSDDKKNLTIDN